MGESFAEMDDLQLRTATDRIILECSAINGCDLPSTELFAESLSNSIISFIVELGYADLTLDEILFSMQMNERIGLRLPSGIEVEEIIFSGRCANVSFLSKVISNYMVIRKLVDRKMQNLIDGYE